MGCGDMKRQTEMEFSFWPLFIFWSVIAIIFGGVTGLLVYFGPKFLVSVIELMEVLTR